MNPGKSLLSEHVFEDSVHCLSLQKLQNKNDPNIDCEPEKQNTEEMWKAVYDENKIG